MRAWTRSNPRPANSPIPLQYLTPGEPAKFVVLRRMGVHEAELARLKLESEGIRCMLHGTATATALPHIQSDVPLLVDEVDVERAKAILTRPVQNDDEGEYDDEERFRCPECHRREIELLPLTGVWKLGKGS